MVHTISSIYAHAGHFKNGYKPLQQQTNKAKNHQHPQNPIQPKQTNPTPPAHTPAFGVP